MSLTNSIHPLLVVVLFGGAQLHAAEFDLAASATNQLAIDLYRQLATGDENLCLSPYSIQSALAMTFAGADGVTRMQMASVLHFSERRRRNTCLVRFAQALARRDGKENA